MNQGKAFIAGFLATLVFHQGLLALLYASSIVPVAPFNMDPTSPLGVPKVISLAFWGGLWGLPIWYLIKTSTGRAFWLKSLIYGAIGPTAVALLVVFPVKDLPVKAAMIPIGLILNGGWGIGTSLLMRAMRAR